MSYTIIMKNKVTPIIIFLVVAVALVLIIVFSSKGSAPETNPAMQGGTSAPLESLNPNTTGVAPSTASASYTLADVAKHKDASSCWTTVNGGVYDVTSWIDQHPGGRDAILSLCGKDGSAAFNGQHGGQARPEQELATFKIGVLLK
jgi:cytochrome b involved in lipid metabolism